jgi:ATP/maltotriose-dependent transcriptional regulator MalT
MSSWLRVLGLRVALLSGLVATVGSPHTAAGKPDLPFVLLDSFDQAFACVYRAAERKVAELEAARPAPRRHVVVAILDALECQVAAACDAASTALDVEIAVADTLPPERRMAVLGCIERHLGEARRALGRASDPEERAEYDRTCERLREIRRLV